MARQPDGSAVRRALVEQYAYDGEQTCAADGSCRVACPVGIDTGKLIKELRTHSHGARAERRAIRLAERWVAVERLGRLGLRAGGAAERLAGERAVNAVTGALGRVVGGELIPRWTAALPRAAPGKLPATTREGAAAVYLPACINRMMGTSRRDGASSWLPQALVDVSKRAGRPVWIPADAPGHCCATPWASKGFRDGHAKMATRLADALWRWSDGGALPVVIDASSCAHGIATEVPEVLDEQRRERLAAVRVLDAVSWASTELLPRLEVRSRATSVTVHPSCSARHLSLAGPLEALAFALSADVFVAIEATCCGMAGDRGLLHPELTAAATADQTRELGDRTFDAYLSSNRTCEVALEQATGKPYESVVQLLERATRA
jgi:D-lactate dehydrogenase